MSMIPPDHAPGPPSPQGASDERLIRVLQRIDEENRQDPNTDVVEGRRHPREWLYARRLTEWVLRLEPNASEVLRIAARGQHVGRWTIPRDRFERTRQGYLRWREQLKAFHIETVTRLMREERYPELTIERVRRLMSKRQLGQDPETQVLEDALCLVFLEIQFGPLRAKTPEEKMREVLRKTWQKMSPRARELALSLPMGEEEKAQILRAVGPQSPSSPGPTSPQSIDHSPQ